MRTLSFLIFIFVFFSIYFLGNFYVALKGIQALQGFTWAKVSFMVVFVFLASSYFISRGLERTSLTNLHQITYWLGSMWIAALLYFFLFVLLIDFVRLVNLGLHFLPNPTSTLYATLKIWTLFVSIFLVMSILSFGYWNASRPALRHINLSIDKTAPNMQQLNIIMVSDIHLGSLFGKSKVANMVKTINYLKPDIVFLAGDILDEVQTPIFENNIGEPLKNIMAPLGVYGITGNHEYIGGINRAVKYLESTGIKLIHDSVVLINGSFYVVGREDKDIYRFTGKTRKPLPEILQNINTNLPLILLDHQPFNLQQAVENGVDLQLSGHTHHGQFWPFNLITKAVYELSYGYIQKGKTHICVSCGYGTWGPPIRIGNKPEIVKLHITFTGK